jgi:HEPN domain-containing protein
MHAADTPRTLACEWLDYAARDLKAAKSLLADSELCLEAAFHAQQAIEKAFKAMCVLKQHGFDKTHDLEALLDEVAAFAPCFAERWADVGAITKYAVEGRYPLNKAGFEVTPAEAVEVADQVVAAVREWFDDQPER